MTYGDHDVEPIHERNVVVVEPSVPFEGDFRQRRRRHPACSVALQLVPTIPGVAVSGVGVAPGPGPEATGPIGRGVY